MQFNRFAAILIVALAILAPAAPAAPGASPAPRLILQVTVDQLRGDLPGRYRDRLGEGGFSYLMEKGTWYVNAHYQHANTETAVGHASLATGADPSRHGIVANDWIDQKTGAFVYNTEDQRHHIIGREAKTHEGVSPRNLLASTISDELMKIPGIAYTMTRGDLLAGRIPESPVQNQIRRSLPDQRPTVRGRWIQHRLRQINPEGGHQQRCRTGAGRPV